MLRDLPRPARWYFVSLIVLGALTFVVLVPRAALTPVMPLVFLVLLFVDRGVQDSVPDRQRLQHVGLLRGRHRSADVESDPGWGATFLIYLPIAIASSRRAPPFNRRRVAFR